MKLTRRIAAAFAIGALAWGLVLTVHLLAQTVGIPTTVVQNSPTKLDSTISFATSASSAATITITPPAGQYVYINQLTIDNCAGTTVTAAAPLSVTSTGLGSGTTPVWTIGTAGTAGMCNPTEGYWGGIPLKSNAPGTNVTFVLPTFTTNQTVRVNVWYYFAP